MRVFLRPSLSIAYATSSFCIVTGLFTFLVISYYTELAEAVNKDKFPVLFSWIDRMKENEAVKKSILPIANHLAFLESVLSGGPGDYGTADLTGKGIEIYTRKE